MFRHVSGRNRGRNTAVFQQSRGLYGADPTFFSFMCILRPHADMLFGNLFSRLFLEQLNETF